MMVEQYSEEEQKKMGARIAKARDNAGLSQTELASRINLNRAVLNKIENGNRPARDLEIRNISEVLDVSTDYLLGKSNKHHYYDLTEKDEIDIAEQAEQIIKGIQTSADVNFYGEPATKEQMESMRDIIETGLRINKEKAKKKFTPKKYRDNGAKGGD